MRHYTPSLNLYYALKQLRECPYEAIKPAFCEPHPKSGHVTYNVSDFVWVTVDVRYLFTGDTAINICVTNLNTQVGRMEFRWSIPVEMSTVILNYMSGVSTDPNISEPNRWLTMLEFMLNRAAPFGYEPDRDISNPRRLTTA
jgi:hypothetical protein